MPPLHRWFFISLWQALAVPQNRFPPFWGAADSDVRTAGTVRPNLSFRLVSTFFVHRNTVPPMLPFLFLRSAMPFFSLRLSDSFVPHHRSFRFGMSSHPLRLAVLPISPCPFSRFVILFCSFRIAVSFVSPCRSASSVLPFCRFSEVASFSAAFLSFPLLCHSPSFFVLLFPVRCMGSLFPFPPSSRCAPLFPHILRLVPFCARAPFRNLLAPPSFYADPLLCATPFLCGLPAVCSAC